MNSKKEVFKYLNFLFGLILNWNEIQDGSSMITLQCNNNPRSLNEISPFGGGKGEDAA